MFTLDHFLPYRLYALSEFFGRRFQTVYKNHAGLTRPEWRVLVTLGGAQTMTATALGQATAMHKTKISRAIAGLEKRRWISRCKRQNDRRFEDVELTKIGGIAYRDLIFQAQVFNSKIIHAATARERVDIENGLNALEQVMKRV